MSGRGKDTNIGHVTMTATRLCPQRAWVNSSACSFLCSTDTFSIYLMPIMEALECSAGRVAPLEVHPFLTLSLAAPLIGSLQQVHGSSALPPHLENGPLRGTLGNVNEQCCVSKCSTTSSLDRATKFLI
jgi:hypothetical protein